MPWESLGSLFTEGWGCDPTWIFVCPAASQQLTECPPPEKCMLPIIPESFASNVLSPQQAIFTTAFPGGPPRTAGTSNPDSHRDPALPWDPVQGKVCVGLLRMGSPFPPVPWSSCTQAPLACHARCSGDSCSQCQIPTCGGLRWGSDLSLL